MTTKQQELSELTFTNLDLIVWTESQNSVKILQVVNYLLDEREAFLALQRRMYDTVAEAVMLLEKKERVAACTLLKSYFRI